MSRQITLEIHNAANDVIGQYQLDTAGKTQHIQAVNGASYQFTDLATGLGPQHITTAKQGSDLLVTFDSGSNLIIENYFTQGQGALVGINADGGLISYPVASVPEHILAEEIAGASTIEADTASTITPLAVLGGVALVAGGIALANHDSGKGSHTPEPAPPVPEPPPFKPVPEPEPKPNTPINPSPEPLPNPNPGAPGPNPSPSNPNPAPSPNRNPGNPGNPGIPNPSPDAYKPFLKDDPVLAKRGTPPESLTIKVTENDTDPQGDIDPDSVKLIDKYGNAVSTLVVDKQGTWSVSRGGNITFTPLASFTTGNPDPVEYILKDRNGNPSYNRAKVSITYDDAGDNHPGSVEIGGEARVGQKLSANVKDEDGVPKDGVKYQWLADGHPIAGATDKEYEIQAGDKGKTIGVHVTYTDEKGHNEAASSKMKDSVQDANTQPLIHPLKHTSADKMSITDDARGDEIPTSMDSDDDQLASHYETPLSLENSPPAGSSVTASLNSHEHSIHHGESTSEIQHTEPALTHDNLTQTGDSTGHINDAPSEIHDGGVLVSPNINPDDYAQLVQHDQAPLDYIKAQSHDIPQKLETELLGVTLRGSDGDDALISSNGVEFLESGKDADTFSPDQNNAHTINNEGYNDTTQSHSHSGHASGVDEIMNAITIL